MKKRILCLLAALMLLIPAVPVAAAEMPEGTSNFDYTFDDADIDGGGAMSTTAEGKPKVVIFFMVTCGHCQSVLSDIANSEWLKEGLADVYAIATDQKVENNQWTTANKADVESFRTTYCSAAGGRIRFGIHTQANTIMFRYANAAGLVDDQNRTTTPIVAIIDADNKLRDVTSGSADVANKIEEKLKALSPDTPENPDDTQNPDTPQDPDTPEDPDTPQNPDTPGNPDTPQNPDTPNPDDTQNPETPAPKPEESETSSSKPACNHVGEYVVTSGATATKNAVAAFQCVKCGAVLRYEEVSNSAYSAFLKETADAIVNAQQKEVVIDTRIWVSFDKSVFEAIKSRPDVTVTVNYYFEGQPYTLQIPAGTNVDTLMDENGFGGFRYIDKVLHTKG